MASRLRVTYNAPVVLTFALAAVVVQLLTDYASTSVRYCFAAWPEFHDWRAYLGLFSHILGHGGWDHLLGNFTIILLIGPILEERHGSLSLLVMILLTALVTGLVNVTFTNDFLVGASGIVFMFVILASLANIRHGDIPLTFIAVALLFLGREVVAAFREDNVSQMAHLLGGAVGATFGFLSARGAPAGAPRLAAPIGGSKPAVPIATARPAAKPAGKP